ncbi:hypothetical protein [Actinoplanes sp. NPDC051859]|uniref:hypothetical protein n=1 Tax=Actinoplanes sp. NPDC051859 TaxID=3363909 RepID=UPI0037876E81
MSFGYTLASILPQLPILAVLITGFIMIAMRRDRLSARSALLARLGLSALIAGQVVNTLWILVLPQLFRAVRSRSDYQFLLTGSGLVVSLLLTVGIALLIAAVVTRGPATDPGRPFAPPHQGFPPQHQGFPPQHQAPYQPQPGASAPLPPPPGS